MKSPDYKRFLLFVFLAIVLYFTLITLLLYYESRTPEALIKQFHEAIWFSVVTLTTVGYGDYVPKSYGGLVIGFVFVLLSLTVYGFIIGRIASFMATIKENQKLGYSGTGFTGHTVIINWDQFGKAVVDQLVGVGKKVAIVTNTMNDIDLIRENYNKKLVYVLFADYSNFDLMRKTNIEAASNVFVNIKDDTEKLVYILNIKKAFRNLKVVVTLENSSLKNTFHSAGTTYTVSKNEISSKLLASYIFEPDVATYSEDIMSYAVSENDYDIKEYKVIGQNPFCHKTYIDTFYGIKKNCNSILIGISKFEKGKRILYKNPDDDVSVDEGDYLIMITNAKSDKILCKLFQIEEGMLDT